MCNDDYKWPSKRSIAAYDQVGWTDVGLISPSPKPLMLIILSCLNMKWLTSTQKFWPISDMIIQVEIWWIRWRWSACAQSLTFWSGSVVIAQNDWLSSFWTVTVGHGHEMIGRATRNPHRYQTQSYEISVIAMMHRIRLDHLQTFFCKFTDVTVTLITTYPCISQKDFGPFPGRTEAPLDMQCIHSGCTQAL